MALRSSARLVGYMPRCPFSLPRLVKVTETGQVIDKAENGPWTMRAELGIYP